MPRILILSFLALFLLPACRSSLQLAPSDAATVLSHQVLDAPYPAAPGAHAVRTLYYGSGTDRHRPEFRDSVAIRTPTVDASKLIDLGDDAKERNRYWGFSPENFPLNARVWYPDGEGPFPLVLVVHGNHDPKDFSDPGYDYLGELLASRGYILASVDMNFVNGSIREENDARGWLLLKHLQLWRDWARDPQNPLAGKVDMERIALMGHSRGGEAVGHAAAFNRLPRYPDDATLEWDFGFAIRSIVAIAPVDGQYLPADQPVPVENVNYLVFHGSHDGDVTSFHGLRQYHRVYFTEDALGDVPLFKSAVYVYRANHGQWNTVWGPNDNGLRSDRILDLRALLDPEDQREFAEIYISAFLDTTLKGDERYLPIFRDHRVIGEWLPKTMYVTRFQPASFRPLATFEEDIDVTTGVVPSVTLSGDSLAVWREGELQLRSRNRPTTSAEQENQAVWLGWNNHIAGEDTARMGRPASYTVAFPDTLAPAWGLDGGWTLDLLLAATDEMPEPRRPEGRDSADAKTSKRKKNKGREDGNSRKPPIDLSIELTDAGGASARLPLSRYGPIRRPLETHILRRGDLEKKRFESLSELVLQGYSLPLEDFSEQNPQLDLSRLRTVRLLFDRTPAGTVVVDDIGFSELEPAWTRATVPVEIP